MRNISESMARIQSLSEFIENSRENAVDEGLKEILNGLKARFASVVKFFKGLAAKLSKSLPYWCPVDEEGDVFGAILPATMGDAMKGGYINKKSTVVALTGESAKMAGYKGNGNDAKKLYPGKNSLDYWRSFVKESSNSERPLRELDTTPLTMEKIEEEEARRIYESVDAEVFVGGEQIDEAKMTNVDPRAKFNVIDNDKLRALIKLRLEHPTLPVLLVWGAPGIGKTAVLEAALAEYSEKSGKNYNLIVKVLSMETPDNFTLPEYRGEGANRKAHDIPKSWMPVYAPTGDPAKDKELDEALGSGLFFVDELSRATDQVLNIMLPLINERRFNEYKLGSGWTIICATNRPEDEASGQAMLGTALKNRFGNVYYEPTCDSWLEWARTQNYMSPALLQWLALPESETMSGGKYFYYDPNTEEDIDDPTAVICTPRSWTNAMRELACYHYTGKLEGWNIFDIDDDIIRMTLNMYVPDNAVECFMSFLQILSSVGDVRQISADIWSGKKIGVDLKTIKKAAIPLSQVIVTMHADKLPTEDEFMNLANWVAGLGWGQMAVYIMDVFKNTFVIDNVDQASKDAIYISKAKRLAYDEAQKARWNGKLAGTLSKYGVESITDLPDYFNGIMVMAKKYGKEVSKYVDAV